jgi:hypothetical protein
MAHEPTVAHSEFAVELLNRVATSGALDRTLRLQAMERGAGGAPMAEPYDGLARQIADASARVTDAQLAAVREACGADVRAFEVVLSAAIGAGLRRWDAAARVIAEAGDAAH